MNNQEFDTLRIRELDKELHQVIKNISDNTGVSIPMLLKPKLRQIADSYSAEIKKSKKVKNKTGQIKITFISKQLKNELLNIAHNKDIDFRAFFVLNLWDIIASYPEHMRKPKQKY